MTTTCKLGDKDIVMVTVPKEADEFYINEYAHELQYFIGKEHWTYELEGIGHTIIGKGDLISEEVAKGLVEKRAQSYRNYLVGEWSDESEVDTTIESLHSFIRSQNMEPGTTLIIQKLK